MLDRRLGDRLERVFSEHQFHAVHREVALVLLDQRVLRLSQDPHQRRRIERGQADDHRQAADELGDQAELEQVVVGDMCEQLVQLRPAECAVSLEADTHVVAGQALFDVRFEPFERPTTDEEDVRRVDLEEILVRMLSPTLRWHVGDAALDDLEQRLLDAFTGDITGDARVVALTRNLVDLVDVDDPAFGLCNVEVRRLDQVEEDVLDIFANVARFREGRRVGDRERHVEHLRERLCKVGFAYASGPDEQDVRLLQLDVVLNGGADALVVVVDRHREHLFGLLLANDVFLQVVVDDLRRGDSLRGASDTLGRGRRGRRAGLFVDDLPAEIDAFVTDIDRTGPSDKPPDLILVFPAKRAMVLDAVGAVSCQSGSPCA